MITALIAALQLVASSPAAPTVTGPLVVKDASRSVSIALSPSADGPMLRVDQLRPVVPVTVSHLMGDRWMIIVKNKAIEVEPGVRLAKFGEETYQLAAAPEVRRGALYVPLQLVVELIPRLVGNLAWDPAHVELRVFSSLSRYADREEARASVAPAAEPRPSTRMPDRSRPTSSDLPPLRSRRLVVVDAGHGGPDGGMHGPIVGGPQIQEKTITLTVAKRVGAALGKRGIDVKYTRTTDTLIALSDRGKIANEAHADLFVSIHVNAANPGWKDPAAARGFETYFLAEAKTEDARRVEQMENEVVKFEAKSSAAAGDPLSYVLNDMAQNEHLRESSDLAQTIQQGLIDVHPGPNRGVQQANFAVLRGSYMPAVLVEIGFGSNLSEATFLSDQANQRALARNIAESVIAYLAHYDSRIGGAR
jgi:N-acetylmuramoyl-L-alanine amidase